MNFLPDTHLLLWTVTNSPRLSTEARLLIGDPGNSIYFSTASVWEVAIKSAKPRTNLFLDPAHFRHSLLAAGYIELPILGTHAVAVRSLPAIHGDPFDRILIAQATVEGHTLLTVDHLVAKYPGPIHRV